MLSSAELTELARTCLHHVWQQGCHHEAVLSLDHSDVGCSGTAFHTKAIYEAVCEC